MLTAALLAMQIPAQVATPDQAVVGGATRARTSAGVIEGVVRTHEGSNVRTLPFAIIHASTQGERWTTLADSLGQYRIEQVPQGTLRLRVSHVAHRSALVNVAVPEGETVSLDIDLEWSPIVMHPIRVIADLFTPPSRPLRRDTPPPAVEVIALGVSPGLSEAGLGEAAAALPGNDPADPSDVLFMRGSTTDLKLVLLDGAPVYTPFHLGGLLSSFDALTLGAAILHTGGAPARYDGGLSYILDLRTRPPQRDRLHVRGGLDLISGNIAAEGPIGGRVGFTASSRSLHDYGASILGGRDTPYGYRDALGRVDVQLGAGHVLSTTAFWNLESVLLNPNPTDSDPSAGFVVPEDATWGNHALVLAYHGRVSDVVLDATASASGYQAELPVRRPPDEQAPAAESDGLLAGAETGRMRLALDGSAPLGTARLRFGAVVDRTETLYSARRFADVGTGTRVDQKRAGLAAGVYADGGRALAPGLDLRIGLRADAFSTERGVRLSPRVALLWSLSSEALLTVAAGRYHQFSRASDKQIDFTASGGALTTPGRALLSVATADHVAVSLDQELTERVRLGIEGFWKGFTGLGASGGEVLHSSGVDLQVLHEGTPVTAWLGYNLSWFWSGGSGIGGTSNFTGRQLLSAGLRGSPDGRIGGSLTVAYSAGLPYTSIPFNSESPNGTANQLSRSVEDLAHGDPSFTGRPDDGFLRLDAELFTRFNARILGQEFDVRPYLRLINALDQRDALFYYFEPWRDAELRPLAERSILPVFGVEWRF
jgi:hypothetical protein